MATFMAPTGSLESHSTSINLTDPKTDENQHTLSSQRATRQDALCIRETTICLQAKEESCGRRNDCEDLFRDDLLLRVKKGPKMVDEVVDNQRGMRQSRQSSPVQSQKS